MSVLSDQSQRLRIHDIIPEMNVDMQVIFKLFQQFEGNHIGISGLPGF